MQRLRVSLIGAVVATACVAAACSADSTSGAAPLPDPVVATDSAGTRFYVADWAGVVAQADTLELTEPAVRIGLAQGDPKYEFDRITAVAPVGESGVAVGDRSLTVRVFDREGTLLTTLGGPGDGPGELRSVRSIVAYRGDSLAVHDATGRRVTIFPRDGGAPRTIDTRAPNQIGSVVLGVLADGRFVVRDANTGAAPGVQREPLALLIHSPLGELEDSILSMPGDEIYSVASSVVVRMRTPFPLRTFTSLSGERVLAADGATSGFDARTLDGALAVRWQSDEARAPVDAAMITAHRDSMLANNTMPTRGGMRQAWEDAIRAIPYPDSLPHTTGMMADSSGTVWLGRDRPGQPPLWFVIASDGRVLRFVRTSSTVTLLAVTPTRAYGVTTDELGVQYLVVYELPGG